MLILMLVHIAHAAVAAIRGRRLRRERRSWRAVSDDEDNDWSRPLYARGPPGHRRGSPHYLRHAAAFRLFPVVAAADGLLVATIAAPGWPAISPGGRQW